jgi:hypothetical protein
MKQFKKQSHETAVLSTRFTTDLALYTKDLEDSENNDNEILLRLTGLPQQLLPVSV